MPGIGPARHHNCFKCVKSLAKEVLVSTAVASNASVTNGAQTAIRAIAGADGIAERASDKSSAANACAVLSLDELPVPEIVTDPVESAKAAGLRYVSDEQPGIRRRRAGKGFSYVGADGKAIHDEATLKRIKSLAIPPAWREVWICASPNGHLQATGLDARNRKQYRYHPRWREVRDETKYERMMLFGRMLPLIRERTRQDLALTGMPREKVLATIVQLLEKTLIRVGNEEYAKENNSYGLTTLRNRHAKVDGSTVHFQFKGKSGIKHSIDLKDRRLARIVEKLQDLPGQELFQYVDEAGETRSIGSADVNAYLKEITGEEFTAKDFRTWSGTVLAALALQEYEAFDSAAQAKKNIRHAIESVARKLGNTPTICRKCYVHPAVLDSYLDGSLVEALQQRTDETLSETLSQLEPEEAAVMVLLHQRLA
jgi:DNA topoisomerase-1